MSQGRGIDMIFRSVSRFIANNLAALRNDTSALSFKGKSAALKIITLPVKSGSIAARHAVGFKYGYFMSLFFKKVAIRPPIPEPTITTFFIFQSPFIYFRPSVLILLSVRLSCYLHPLRGFFGNHNLVRLSLASHQGPP